MKRLIIIAFAFLALNVYSQGNQHKNVNKLQSEALKRGPVSNDTYQIDNKKNLYVTESYAIELLEERNYLVIECSQKKVVRFGEPMVIVDKLSFMPYDSYSAKKYMFDQLKGDNPISFDQLKSTGNFFFPRYEDKSMWGYYTKTVYRRSCCDVTWSGTTIDGYLDGKGIGYYIENGRMYLVEGEFVAGFPSKKVTEKKFYTKGMNLRPKEVAKLTYQLDSIGYYDVEFMKDTAKGDLRKCVMNYVHIYNNKKAGIVNDEFEKALALNNNKGDFSSFYSGNDNKNRINNNIKTFNNIVKINRKLNLREFNDLDSKIKELMLLYDVLSVLDDGFYRQNYITESIMWGTTFEMEKALGDTSRFFTTERYIRENAKNTSKSSFRKFFATVEPTMDDRSERLYDNINSQIQKYNGMDKTPDIFHRPSNSSYSSSSSSSTSNSDRSRDNDEVKTSESNSKNMLSCKVKIKLPDGTYYKIGNVECWIHKGKWSDEGGYIKCWVDDNGNCTISWEEKRGDYIYEILNICQFGKCYHVKGVELKNGGDYTLKAEAN